LGIDDVGFGSLDVILGVVETVIELVALLATSIYLLSGISLYFAA
jgi:hypothetical protein